MSRLISVALTKRLTKRLAKRLTKRLPPSAGPIKMGPVFFCMTHTSRDEPFICVQVDGQTCGRTGGLMDGAAEQTPWQRLGNKFTLGLRTRTEAEWLPHADAFGNPGRHADQLVEKSWLFDNRHDEVFAAIDDSKGANRTACAEVLAMVTAHLAAHHETPPDPANPDLADTELHPLEAAARMVPEDLLLLSPRQREDDDGLLDWVLVAAALAFPAHWVLAEKMGRPLAGIHEPVPHYGERLERPMDKFFTNMAVGPISHRWNWSVMTSDKLFTPHRMRRAPLAPGAGIDQIFIRMESQTLRKLPQSGMVLFTIRTYAEPLSRWAGMPGAVASLLEMLDGMTPQMRAYKGFDLYEDALRSFVSGRD